LANSVIEVRQVSKRFDGVQAVRDVSLSVEAGEIFGLIGHNGAGKSTLFKMMLGLIPLTAGEIRVHGEAVRGPAFRRVRRDIGYLPENVVFYDNLTGIETLHFFAKLKGADRQACAALLDKVGLTHAAGRKVRGYSKGMRQRLGFAQALLGAPRLLFLDEPTTGLDPEGIRQFYEILAEMRGRGVTVILTSHILAEIQERVDRLAMMREGEVQAMGTVSALREQMGLPLWFEATLAAGDAEAALRGALAPVPGCELQVRDGLARVYCGRRDKMRVLNLLGGLQAVTDIQIREPSLEDVFLGYASCSAGKAAGASA